MVPLLLISGTVGAGKTAVAAKVSDILKSPFRGIQRQEGC
jgi:uridine kinase